MSRTFIVLVYSDDAAVRDALTMAIGRRPAADLGKVELREVATLEELLEEVDGGGVDVAVLDGEARPAGGFGIAKQIKDELRDCPATLVLTARPLIDAWLADWALADAVASLPVDPADVRSAVVRLLRDREAALPVRRAAAI